MAEEYVQFQANRPATPADATRIGVKRIGTVDIQVNIIVDQYGDPISVQNPLPTDGDSVYGKDLDLTLSDIGTFTGEIESLFEDYTTEITDTTATNPKTFTVRMQRPLTTSVFALASLTGDFSNTKILFKDIAGTTRYTIDESGDNTKYTARVFPLPPITFGTVVVEFHTADAVAISGSFITKDLSVVARLRALKPDGTVTDIDATAGGNLKVSVEEYDDATNPVRPNMEGGGKVSVGTTAVEVTFTGTPTYSIIISAPLDNEGTLYVGKSDVTSAGVNAFAYIDAGETLTIEYEDSDNAVYVVASVADQSFFKGALL